MSKKTALALTVWAGVLMTAMCLTLVSTIAIYVFAVMGILTVSGFIYAALIGKLD